MSSRRRAPAALGLCLALLGVPGTGYAQGEPSVAPAPSAPPLAASPAPAPSPAPSVPPAAEPSAPGPSASSVPPSPAPSPLPTSTPAPLALERTSVRVVPGGTVGLRVSGGSGTVGARTDAPSVVGVAYDPVESRLALTGRAPGSANVIVFDGAGETVSVSVLVAPPAGVVPGDLTVELGGTVSPKFVTARIQAALAAAAQLRPGATLAFNGALPAAPLRPGDAFDTFAHVHVSGGSAYVDVDGTTNVRVTVESLAQLDPQVLFYSDDPEKLEAESDGVVYRGTVVRGKPARLYLYHVAVASTHGLFLVFRVTGTGARVQMLGSVAGPAAAFAFVGHVATYRYLLARAGQESAIANVDPDAPYVARLGASNLQAGELVAGALDLNVLSGDAVEVDVVSTDGLRDPTEYVALPELPGDGHGRRGEFDLSAIPPIALAFTAGAPDPPGIDVGAAILPNLRPGAKPLAGDYGVLRDVTLTLANPLTDPQTVYLYEMPVGGSSTSSIWFSGDDRPAELPCVYRPNRYGIKAFTLAPGQTQTVSAQYMTDGAAAFPLDFGLTGTPPSPLPGPDSPDACNPRPSTAPSPAPSPQP